MALNVHWRYSCYCVIFVLFFGQVAALFQHPDDVYKYDMLPETEGSHVVTIVKRNVMESQPQIVQPSEKPTPATSTPHPTESQEAAHPDQEVLKNSHLLGNNTAKTGGNYLTANNTNGDVSKNNSTFKGTKWLETVQRGLNKSGIDISRVLAHFANVSTSLPNTPTMATEVTNGTNESSKAESNKTPKKAESITKPPKPDPIKPSMIDDKTKKPVPPGSEEGEKAVVVPTSHPEATSTTTQQTEPEIEIGFPQDISNKTLKQNDITNIEEDHHLYYNSSFVVNNEEYGHAYWVEMTNRTDVHVNELLSQSHRRAATVKLTFDFPFYGNLVRNVTIATGGFLYTGDYVHSWLAATQYIAPLMANFDTSLSNHSFVKYVDNGTAFTVQWERVVLQDKPNSGDFTFQATLYSNGDIVFVYRSVPIVIESIQDDHHPVKVGLSDAYIIDRNVFFVRRKTIYEYHRVNFDRQDIKNWTVIYLNALPTCLDARDCGECLSRATSFQCHWCPGANRCSNGMDRFRQDWLSKGCDRISISNISRCPSTLGTSTNTVSSQSAEAVDPTQVFSDKHSSIQDTNKSSMGVSGIIAVLFITALFSGFAIWVFYAYRNPHTASGQFLIKYRPSVWSWRRGEARYTAATIHM